MEKLVKQFRDILPLMRKNEVWRSVDFSNLLTDQLSLSNGERQTAQYHCNIPDLDAQRLVVENGYCHEPISVAPNGVTTGSLRSISSQRPDFIRQYFSLAPQKSNPYLQFNTDHYTDGLFIYIPDGTRLEQPIQLQSVINAGHGLFLQVRNLVIVGRGSHATFIHCDDSYDNSPAFANNVTEIHIAEDFGGTDPAAQRFFYRRRKCGHAHPESNRRQPSHLHGRRLSANQGQWHRPPAVC